MTEKTPSQIIEEVVDATFMQRGMRASVHRDAILAALAAADYVIVPRKPTLGMTCCGDERILSRLNDHSFALKLPTPAGLCWEAMVDEAAKAKPVD